MDGTSAGPADGLDPVDAVESAVLGERPRLVRAEVARRAEVDLEVADQLWHLLGFAHAADDDPAFTEADVRALRLTHDLIELGILSSERQEGLVRTWGRSFARLAEWQVGLLTEIAAEKGGDDPGATMIALADEVLPRVEELQTYVWRRHLVSVASRLLATQAPGSATVEQAVCFVDIVGYTSKSRTLSERDLIVWLEDFESAALDTVVEHGGRIIKNIGDEVMIVADTAEDAAAIALGLARRGEDPDDPFPAVRAGIAYGEVVARLGDVFGPVVNIASRLTKEARPCSVLVDLGMYEALTGQESGSDDDTPEPPDGGDDEGDDATPYRLKRVRRLSVKGYSRLKVWVLLPRA